MYATCMTELMIIVIGAIGLGYVSQFNTRLRDLKLELLKTTHDLKKRIEKLEQNLGSNLGAENTSTSSVQEVQLQIQTVAAKAVTPDPIPSVFQNSLPKESAVQTVVSNETKATHYTYKPDAFEELLSKIKNYFMTGNTIVKVGVVLIFFGISFLLKYAIDNDMLPVEIRLIGSALLGVGLVKLGWNLRLKSRDYGLVLQGGGIGILMLTTFVALKSYGLISPALAFFLLVSFTAATCFLAVYQDSRNLAAFGLLGGFLAPVLASTGQGQHVVLFSYYTILNLGVIFISWKKSWRELNLLGFIFTFGIGIIWGVLKYNPDFYWSTQPFLIIFFLIYVTIPLLFANKKEPELKGYVDGTLVFGNSLLTLVLQLQLVKGTEYAGAFSALTLAAFYIFLSRYLIKHKNSNYRLISEAFISLGVVFVTVAMPLAFDGLKTSAIWALEAAGIYWLSIKQNRQVARYFSTFLIFATSFSFFLGPARGSSDIIFLNSFFFSCVLMAVGSYFISYMSEKFNSKLSSSESGVSITMFIMGSLWWILGGLYEIDRFTFSWLNFGANQNEISIFSYALALNVQLFYLTIGACIVFWVGQKIAWERFRFLAHGFVFVLILVFLTSLHRYEHPFQNFGYFSWAIAFLTYYYILFYNDKNFDIQSKLFLRLGHAGALWVLVGVFARELNWLGNIYVGESSAWRLAAQAAFPIFAIWFITEKKNSLPWPVARHHSTYMHLGLAPVVVISWLWLMITNWTHNGSSEPLPYVTLLNPLEISHLGLLLAISIWFKKLFSFEWIEKFENKKTVGIFLGATYFIWLNGVLCRAIHHYMGIPFYFSSLFSSAEVQVSLSIFWTLLGIAIMVYGSKKQFRWLWVTGAGLLAVVVAKMFLIDLSKTETIARVVSFIGVGILFLIVGYFSPIPPKVNELETKDYGN